MDVLVVDNLCLKPLTDALEDRYGTPSTIPAEGATVSPAASSPRRLTILGYHSVVGDSESYGALVVSDSIVGIGHAAIVPAPLSRVIGQRRAEDSSTRVRRSFVRRARNARTGRAGRPMWASTVARWVALPAAPDGLLERLAELTPVGVVIVGGLVAEALTLLAGTLEAGDAHCDGECIDPFASDELYRLTLGHLRADVDLGMS